MIGINTNIQIITVNVNSLNTAMKKTEICVSGIQKNRHK